MQHDRPDRITCFQTGCKETGPAPWVCTNTADKVEVGRFCESHYQKIKSDGFPEAFAFHKITIEENPMPTAKPTATPTAPVEEHEDDVPTAWDEAPEETEPGEPEPQEDEPPLGPDHISTNFFWNIIGHNQTFRMQTTIRARGEHGIKEYFRNVLEALDHVVTIGGFSEYQGVAPATKPVAVASTPKATTTAMTMAPAQEENEPPDTPWGPDEEPSAPQMALPVSQQAARPQPRWNDPEYNQLGAGPFWFNMTKMKIVSSKAREDGKAEVQIWNTNPQFPCCYLQDTPENLAVKWFAKCWATKPEHFTETRTITKTYRVTYQNSQTAKRTGKPWLNVLSIDPNK